MIACPLCRSTAHTIASGRAGVWNVRTRNVICRGCGLVFRNPPWDERRMQAFHRFLSRYYADVYDADRLTAELGERQAGEARRRVEWLREHTPDGGRVLDVGAGNACFVAAALAAGYEAEGVELDEDAVAYARERGLPIHLLPFEELDRPDGHFATITMFDVLEHSADLHRFLATARRLLRPGGCLLIEVPNALTARVKLEFYLAPEHNWHFTPATLRHLLTAEGWRVAELGDQPTPHNVADAVACAAIRPEDREVVAVEASGPEEHDRVLAHFEQIRQEGRLSRAMKLRNGLTVLLGPSVGGRMYRMLIGAYVAAKKTAGLYRDAQQEARK